MSLGNNERLSSHFGTFGRYEETPVDRMSADMRAAYDYTVKLRGIVPPPHRTWLANPQQSTTIVPTGAQTESALIEAEIEIEIATSVINAHWRAAYADYEHEKIGEEHPKQYGPPSTSTIDRASRPTRRPRFTSHTSAPRGTQMISSARFLFGVLIALLVASLAACGTARADRGHMAPASQPVAALQLPPTTGNYDVATISRPILDASRHRELMIQIWYPTLASEGRPAPYDPPRVARLVAAAYHYPTALFASIATHALAGARPAAGEHPVILYSPGTSEMRNDASAVTENLASQGYVVIGIDHPGESQFVLFPDGRIIAGSFKDTGPASNTRQVRVRVRDVIAVLHALPAIEHHGLLAGALDLNRTGMFGFSLGGATTAAAMRALPQIQAGLDLDGSLYGTPLSTPLRRPFILVASTPPPGYNLESDQGWRAGWRELKGFRREIELRHSGHLSFTDVALFIDELHLRHSPSYRRVPLGSIPATRADTATRQLIAAFFDRFLRHDLAAQTQLDDPSTQNPNLVRLR